MRFRILLFLLFQINCLVLFSQNPDRIEREFEQLNQEFEHFLQKNKLDESSKTLKKLAVIATKKNHETKTNTLKFRYYKSAQKYYQAIDNIDSVKWALSNIDVLAEKYNNGTYKAYYFNQLGLVHKANLSYDSALFYLKKGLTINLHLKDSANLVMSYHGLAAVYSKTVNYDTAIFYLNKSLAFVDSIKHPDDYTDVMNSIGSNYCYKGSYNLALSYYLLALENYRKSKNWKNELMVLEQIGALYCLRKNYSESLNYFYSALSIAQQHNLAQKKASLYLNIGVVNIELKKWDEARNLLNKAFVLYKKQNDLLGLTAYYGNSGKIKLDEGKYDEAILLIEKGVAIGTQLNYKADLSILSLMLGECYFYKKNYQKAIEQYRLTIQYEQELGGLEFQKKAYQRLAETLYLLKKYPEAWEAKNRYLTIKDSMDNVEINNNLNEIKIVHETELKEAENQQLLQEIKLNVQKLKQEKIIFRISISLFILGLLLLIALIFLLNNRIKIKKNEIKLNELKIENQQKEHEIMFSKLNETKNSMIEKAHIITTLEKELKLKFNESDFAKNLLHKISKDNNWTLFIAEFEILYPHFLNSLKKQNSKLTTLDLRIIALIKLNLSNKEMSEMLNIEYSSIKKAKYRLKKKLNLSTEESLYNYTHSL